MSKWIAVLFLMVFMPPPVAAGDGDKAAIKSVIERQVEAFRRDDGKAAFAFASPGVQAMFKTPEIFMTMVKSGYPQVYRPRKFTFLATEGGGDAFLQKVLVEGPQGQLVLALYAMIRVDGKWRINGCTLGAAPGKQI